MAIRPCLTSECRNHATVSSLPPSTRPRGSHIFPISVVSGLLRISALVTHASSDVELDEACCWTGAKADPPATREATMARETFMVTKTWKDELYT
jgi:hypothetical protein